MGVAEEWLKYAPKPRQISGGDRWNVFLSYRSVNRIWVLNLYDVLHELGHEVFLDQVALRAGDSLTETLQVALGASQAGILIWSTATADSTWVKREYGVMERLASDKPGFQFVPVRLDRTSLPPIIGNRVFLDFTDYPDGPNGGELLRLLHAITGTPLSPEAAYFAAEQDEAAQRALNRIKAAIRNDKGDRLIEMFNQGDLPWRISAALGCKSAEGLTRLGRDEDAVAMLAKLETQFPRAIRPRQLHALAFARQAARTKNIADLDLAQEILAELYEAGERDPETLGIYARTWMDRYDLKGNPRALRTSRKYYAEAFASAQDDYYTGINAAAKSVLIGTPQDLEEGRKYAERVLKIVGSEASSDDYWRTATSAEAHLILKDYAKAGELYQSAVDIAPMEIGSHRSTWQQARRLLAKLGATDEERQIVTKAFGHLDMT